MVAVHPSAAEVWSWLRDIADPEIPALSIIDLGIVRDVQAEEDRVTVTITPTYSACPAMDRIADDIRARLKQHGVEDVHIATKLSPAWTTDWLPAAARERLREYGIAPPQQLLRTEEIRPVSQPDAGPVVCPHCGSDTTVLVSRFGSTLCKALYKCLACREPFDAFKHH
ncbi:MAG TPA: 1,2-phenylacetyl-CoA epoxidase subunit PaaD [Bryobacteraceae bacterium]|jgi:ring-1,2-phenylacetyl-CoA epoxidase subunit PaaD